MSKTKAKVRPTTFDSVIVPYEEYVRMKNDQEMFHALLDVGVKDWSKYGQAVNLVEETKGSK